MTLLVLFLACAAPPPPSGTAAPVDPHAGHTAPVDPPPGKAEVSPVDPHAGHPDSPSIQISSLAIQQLGIRVAPVRSGAAAILRRGPASVSFDVAATTRISSQTGGLLRAVHIPAPGQKVVRGQLLAEIYSPEAQAALEELRLCLGLGPAWKEAAVARVRALGIPDEVRLRVEGGASVPTTIPLHSPSSGVVSSRLASEGLWLAPGGVLALLVDPAAVWVDLVVDGSLPPTGTRVDLSDSAGAVLTTATVVELLPEASAAGRRLRLRPDQPLPPGQPLVAQWTENTASSLWIPSSALVDTGKRQVVFVRTDAGFMPHSVQVGVRAGDEVEVRGGLQPGDVVASHGAFLLDSETQIGTLSHAGHGG